ncbi:MULTISPECIES: glycosyltransferase family 2 protein [unclassified Salinibacterium]|uniref:glycosyltransferase family 2 protein n=1 Tax=unclassified Salinibacterium TaxID=2632331 RepID=UPI0014246E90|nr:MULTISPECIES: glycosyltransferase family 2 protein [unclassified Salinibacterium]
MTSDDFTISVVIPVKDDAGLLEHCLRALSAQTLRPDEVIVVDNASTDRTPEVARRWPVVYVREELPGIAAAASTGYDHAHGTLIARIDADSVPHPNWLADVVQLFRDDPGLAAVTGPGTFDALPTPLARLADLGYMRAYFRLMGRAAGKPPLFGSNFAMRRRVWLAAREHVHRHDPNVHDDLDLTFAFPPGARIAVDDRLAIHISARPFRSPFSFAKRIWRGMRTVRLGRRAQRRRAREATG